MEAHELDPAEDSVVAAIAQDIATTGELRGPVDLLRQVSSPGSADPVNPFGPKTADHPSVGLECPACHVPFIEGDWTTLVTLGPADDEDARRRCRENRPYNAVALEVHFACVTGVTLIVEEDASV